MNDDKDNANENGDSSLIRLMLPKYLLGRSFNPYEFWEAWMGNQSTIAADWPFQTYHMYIYIYIQTIIHSVYIYIYIHI